VVALRFNDKGRFDRSCYHGKILIFKAKNIEKQILIFLGVCKIFWIVVFESSLQGKAVAALFWLVLADVGLVVVTPQSSGNVF
jgi:hypothetical protein